mmetsp:Transcript_12305/g.37538  ORF Transcript_12305/g.37538 Transcript_12305/m.37538 type:complete len:553 (-) Transcript_12305:141-1799(-)|eukprot:CAMPEP_0198729198 /NCGR_PEP_ID=MMETSP1475-20131203/15564_1 /TAXON_ID= ORGANISM="Unidentified sp., Strain CCMP1999" /NCGR_SAMPLE_ID=MMETSP1475 /ASSEMBLY_ACC=CAM_ASM_001111 /LENGTH=552 /DNA_ID=CAMNT_0044491783 /DNA_START=540 /DNA_END=2198 /DNA_ORIENTATION=+
MVDEGRFPSVRRGLGSCDNGGSSATSVEDKLASLSYSFSQHMPAPKKKKSPFERNFPELNGAETKQETLSIDPLVAAKNTPSNTWKRPGDIRTRRSPDVNAKPEPGQNLTNSHRKSTPQSRSATAAEIVAHRKETKLMQPVSTSPSADLGVFSKLLPTTSAVPRAAKGGNNNHNHNLYAFSESAKGYRGAASGGQGVGAEPTSSKAPTHKAAPALSAQPAPSSSTGNSPDGQSGSGIVRLRANSSLSSMSSSLRALKLNSPLKNTGDRASGQGNLNTSSTGASLSGPAGSQKPSTGTSTPAAPSPEVVPSRPNGDVEEAAKANPSFSQPAPPPPVRQELRNEAPAAGTSLLMQPVAHHAAPEPVLRSAMPAAITQPGPRMLDGVAARPAPSGSASFGMPPGFDFAPAPLYDFRDQVEAFQRKDSPGVDRSHSGKMMGGEEAGSAAMRAFSTPANPSLYISHAMQADHDATLDGDDGDADENVLPPLPDADNHHEFEFVLRQMGWTPDEEYEETNHRAPAHDKAKWMKSYEPSTSSSSGAHPSGAHSRQVYIK